jgi:hypothetical protein
MNKVASLLFLLVVMGVGVLAPAYGAEPERKLFTLDWSRTPLVTNGPAKTGCSVFTPTARTNQTVRNNASPYYDNVYSLPVQLKIVNGSTTAITVCATQDPAPSISRLGVFSADGSSLYSAGNGPCMIIPSGVTDFMGISETTFVRRAGFGVPIGSRPGVCTTSNAPCRVDADCTATGGTTCQTTTGKRTAYVDVVHTAGSGATGVVAICEVE